MTSYTALWHELRDHYRPRRPVDLWTGVPLLTDADVVALARRWSRVLDDHARDLGGAYAPLGRWWGDQRERLDRTTSLDRVRQFWRASFDLARELSYQLGRVGRRVRNAATADDGGGLVRFQGMKDWLQMHMAIKSYFVERRGFDLRPDKIRVPRTTNDDVRQLVKIWDRAAAGARVDPFGRVKGAVADWKAVATEAKQLLAGADPVAVYAQNLEFWKVSQRLARNVQASAERPPDITFTDALVESILNVPETIGGALSAAGGAVGDKVKHVAGGAAGVAGDMIAKVGKPLLVGAAVLGGGMLAISLLRK